jgi:hypothetical protein
MPGPAPRRYHPDVGTSDWARAHASATDTTLMADPAAPRWPSATGQAAGAVAIWLPASEGTLNASSLLSFMDSASSGFCGLIAQATVTWS